MTYIIRVQKISVSTPTMVIRNSTGVGNLTSQYFKRKYEVKLEIEGGGGASQIALIWGVDSSVTAIVYLET